jgi:hypothetical protein
MDERRHDLERLRTELQHLQEKINEATKRLCRMFLYFLCNIFYK